MAFTLSIRTVLSIWRKPWKKEKMNSLVTLIPYVILIAAQTVGLVYIVRVYREIRRMTK